MTSSVRALINTGDDLARRVTDGGDPPPPFGTIRDGYARAGLAPGSAILVLAPNTVEFLLHWLGIVANGYVPCAVAPSTGLAALDALRGSLGFAGIVGQRLGRAAADAHRSRRIGTFELALWDDVAASHLPFETLLLTTGTSGAQTACVHSVDSLVWNAAATNTTLAIGARDRQLVVLPMYHSFGLVTQAIGTLVGGGELRIDGPPFNAARFAAAIAAHGITVCGLTPTIVRDLLQRGTALPRLRNLSIGGDQVRADEVAALLAKPWIEELYITYGLTEAGPRVSVLAAHEAPASAHDTVGQPFAGVDTRIDAPDDQGVGQLLVRTPSVCRRKVGPGIEGQPLTRDGFLETGDLFSQDEAGFLRYKARRADILTIKGEKLNTSSVDRVARSHPDIEFARTSEGAGNSLVTRLWPKEDKVLDLDAIKMFMRASLRPHEVPDALVQQPREAFHK